MTPLFKYFAPPLLLLAWSMIVWGVWKVLVEPYVSSLSELHVIACAAFALFTAGIVMFVNISTHISKVSPTEQ